MICPQCRNNVLMLFPTRRGHHLCIKCKDAPATIPRMEIVLPIAPRIQRETKPVVQPASRQPVPPKSPKPPEPPKPVKEPKAPKPPKPAKPPKAIAFKPEPRWTAEEAKVLAMGWTHVRKEPFPRGVWKCPVTGHLHTAAVVLMMQVPVDPSGQPFASDMTLRDARKAEAEERKAEERRELEDAHRESVERAERKKQMEAE